MVLVQLCKQATGRQTSYRVTQLSNKQKRAVEAIPRVTFSNNTCFCALYVDLEEHRSWNQQRWKDATYCQGIIQLGKLWANTERKYEDQQKEWMALDVKDSEP